MFRKNSVIAASTSPFCHPGGEPRPSVSQEAAPSSKDASSASSVYSTQQLLESFLHKVRVGCPIGSAALVAIKVIASKADLACLPNIDLGGQVVSVSRAYCYGLSKVSVDWQESILR